uniref:Reverse transcriptase zinc-binding domain-containing protein n=1 Tax=Anguilla anguilla TaxID=7936 RepID=A0A0E9XH21_ANGAN
MIKYKRLFNYDEKWSNDILLKPKLRTYIHVKQNHGPEPYIMAYLTRSQRSLVAQLRTGILLLAIEVGRFNDVIEEKRLCLLCDLCEIENESHFMLYCTYYDDLRAPIFHEMSVRNPEVFLGG